METKPNKILVRWEPFSGSDYYELSPVSRTYSESMEFITREERASNGKLRRDIIAKKRVFNLAYELIDDMDLNLFDTLLNMTDKPMKLEITKNNIYGTAYITEVYDVLMRPYNRERFLCFRGGLWKNVSIEFVEV